MCALCSDVSIGQYGYAGAWCDCEKLSNEQYYYDIEEMLEIFRIDGPLKDTDVKIYPTQYDSDVGIAYEKTMLYEIMKGNYEFLPIPSSYADIDSEFYPGDQYVDIIGRDTYNCTDASGMASQYEAITQTFTTKMAALSECGNVPDMAAQWSAGAKWLFFMPWYDSENDGTESFAHEHADMEWWKASFESDAVITRDELPDDLFN